jgi:hypothetical protein
MKIGKWRNMKEIKQLYSQMLHLLHPFAACFQVRIDLNKKIHRFGWSAAIGQDQVHSFNEPYAVKEQP